VHEFIKPETFTEDKCIHRPSFYAYISGTPITCDKTWKCKSSL
jgi:hypothetical protein